MALFSLLPYQSLLPVLLTKNNNYKSSYPLLKQNETNPNQTWRNRRKQKRHHARLVTRTSNHKWKKQAKILAERLKDIKIDIIFTSDLKRFVETAKEIAKYHSKTKFMKEKLLRKMGKGIFEGKKRNEINWESVPGDFFVKKAEGGESFTGLWDRLKKFYSYLLKTYDVETILIVTHGGSLCFLQGLILRKDMKESIKIKNQKNTAMSEFEINKKGNYKIICLDCDKHQK
ncbi:MAG: histidine phosphatase family protein [Candidatus Woesearchaeota archaeon]